MPRSKDYADVVLIGGPLDGLTMELCMKVDISGDVLGGMSIDLDINKIEHIEIRGHRYVRPKVCSSRDSDGWIAFSWERMTANSRERG